MLIQAGLESKTSAEIADAYEAAFHADEAAVNILPAHAFPRATDHIPEMVALAEELQDLGHAYATDAGNVYYAVASFPGYGRLSGNSLDDLRAGHRGEVEPDKRDPADFALWKAAGSHRALKWPTARWGDGFPGWHSGVLGDGTALPGDRFDVHTGGIDNVFPHHEDEIAQSAPLVGGPPARLLGPRRAPAHGRRNMAQVGRQLPACHGALRPWRGPARPPLPRDDLPVRAQAELHRAFDRRRGGRTPVPACRPSPRSAPPPDDRPWKPPVALRAAPAGDRPAGIATSVAGLADPRTSGCGTGPMIRCRR